MADDIIRKFTFMDGLLFIFGCIVLFTVGTDAVWLFFGICGFIIIKAYIRSRGVVERLISPEETGRALNDDESDWDDDDNLVMGLYD